MGLITPLLLDISLTPDPPYHSKGISMTKRLVVADSATKIEFLTDYFGDNTNGILCRWPLFNTLYQAATGPKTKEMFLFEALPEAEALIKALNDNRDSEVFLAFDCDAIGELVSWQISGYAAQIGAKPEMTKRLRVTGFSRHELDYALQAIESSPPSLGQAAYIRRIFDEYLGRHLQRLLGTDRGPGNLLLRHHNLTILFLLIERHQERQRTKAVHKWQIQGQLEGDGHLFPASLIKGVDLPANGLFSDKDKAQALTAKLEQYPFEVKEVSRSSLEIAPPPPYRLPELAHDASVRLGLDLGRTIAIVMKLYYGIDYQGHIMGLITSFSPDAPPPSSTTLIALREQVTELSGKLALGEHVDLDTGMIVPLLPQLDGTHFSQSLNQDETALYDLIRKRALASQMKPAIGETIRIEFLVNREYVFQSHCLELTDTGFLQALPEKMPQAQTTYPSTGVEQGQKFRATLQCQPSPSGGQVLESYTTESLFEELADFSIVPDPETISLLGELAALKYLAINEQGRFETTEQATQVATILERAFPKMQGLNLSAYIEQTINEALSGRKDLPFALKQFSQTLMLHGKPLVKPKISPKVQPSRAKTSSTIIKQTSPRPGAEESDAPSDTPDSAPPLPPEAQLPADNPAATTPLPPQEQSSPENELKDDKITSDEGQKRETEPPPIDELQGNGEPKPEQTPETLAPSDDLLKLFADTLTSNAAEADPMPQQPAPIDKAGQPLETPPKRAHDSQQGKDCPACGQPMTIKEDHFGTYWQCTGFPACRYSETGQELPCPLCGQILARKQTPTGKHFFACEENGCQFMSWSTPHYLPCGLCDSPYLVEKIVQGGPQLRCPRAGCSYAQPFPEQPVATEPTPVSTSPKKVMVRRAVSGTGTTAGGTKKVRVVRRKS